MRNIILFSILLASSAASAIDYTSSKALQFFMPVHDFDEKNIVGFPQEVPSKAYYTAQDYAGKELRVTTNIASAVYSTVSGLLERYAWMYNIHDDLSYLNNSVQWRLWWDYEIYEDQDSFIDACRYRDFNRMDTYLSTAYKYSTSRHIETRRFSPAKLLKDAREELILMATDVNRYDEYYFPCLVTSRYLTDGWYVPQEYSRFPIFNWTSNLVYTIREEIDWKETLPTVLSAQWNDGLWKTNDIPEGTYYLSYLFPVFEWFAYFEEYYNDQWIDIEDVNWDWDATNLTWSIYTKYASAQSTMPLSEILCSEFWDWDLAARFTNQTLRVDYYTMGTIEHAVGSIDTSYNLARLNNDYLTVHVKSYEHKWSSYLPEETVITNTPTKVRNEEGGWDIYLDIPAFDDGDWKRTEIWVETTNSVIETENPHHICTGDDPYYGGSLGAHSPEFSITFEELLDEMDRQGTTSIRLPLANPTIDLDGANYLVDFGGFLMEKSCIHALSGNASVLRRTQIETTLSEASTNHVDQQYFGTPSKYAFEWGMIDHVYSQALQSRLLIVDPELDIWSDEIRWEQGTGAVWRAETRSVSLGNFYNWDSLVNRWKNVDLSLNASLESILPYPLSPRESLLPLPQNEIRKVENAIADGGRGMKMGFISSEGNFRTYTINDARDQMTVFIELDDSAAWRFLNPGETETLGVISGSTNITIDIERRIPRRRPFAAEADVNGLHTTRWKFNSIRPSY